MIINITQHCTLRCPHCMQCAGPERTEFMSEETFQKALEFADNIGSATLLISGGEPTSHPKFLEFLKASFNRGKIVSVLSNGTFLRDHSFTERYAEMVKNKLVFSMQISSFKGLYDNYDEIHKPNLKGLRLFGDKVVVCDETNTSMQIKPLGRASSGKWYNEAVKANNFPSCANSCLILAQTYKTTHVGEMMENFGKFCIPIVSWDGSIRLGESEQCKVVANIHDPFEEVIDKIYKFRPCGGCDSYKWHFENPTTNQEKMVSKVLWSQETNGKQSIKER